MLSIFDPFRELTWMSVGVRLIVATVCGGVIGVERSYKRRAAGMRTHILICLGAAMTTLTGQYLMLIQHYYTDVTRIGAKVITGISFIGAGTIIVTRRQRVRGLTTAAGLWGSAIIGLAVGAGFFEGGIIATVLILMAELFLSKLEYSLVDTATEVDLYIEFAGRFSIENVLNYLRENGLGLLNIEITKRANEENAVSCAFITIRLTRSDTVEDVMAGIRQINGVSLIEDLREASVRNRRQHNNKHYS